MGNLLPLRSPSRCGREVFGSRIAPHDPLGRVTMASIGIAATQCRGQSISPGDTVEPPKKKENRPLVVHVRFEPSRLATDYLAAAYEQIVPIRRHRVSPPPARALVPHALAQTAEQGRQPC